MNSRRRREHARRDAVARSRAIMRRAQRNPSTLEDWPDTTGLSDDEGARIIEKYFFWLDYSDRND